MNDRADIADRTASGLRGFLGAAESTKVMLGFDGFVDSIAEVVDQRHDTNRYDPVRTIDQFGQKILQASGQSSNYELVTRREKIGGNGPIMANAMAIAGLSVTYVGTLGQPQVHSVFEPLARRAEVYSLGVVGRTDALEFTDGKLMLGKYSSFDKLDWQRVKNTLGSECFTQIVSRSRLIAMVNWTMLARIETVWDRLLEMLSTADHRHDRKTIFIDLADPEKRTKADLSKALHRLKGFRPYADVVLGLNLKESIQVARAVQRPVPEDLERQLDSFAADIRKSLDLSCVVIHPRGGAAASMISSGEVVSAWFSGPFVRKPKISTGAGDNFNAGFCLGILAGLNLEQQLCAGTAASGFYVRQGASPTLNQLVDFCEQLPEPQRA